MTLVATPQAIHFPNSPTPSLASVSSRSSSVWSSHSTASSNATSVTWSSIGEFSAPPTAILPPLSSQTIPGPDLHRRSTAPARGSVDQHGLHHPHPSDISQQPLPIEQRQNSRRTNRLVEGKCPATETCALPPVPSLQRQADRKVNFVENLVEAKRFKDSAAQIVETIWQPPKYLECGPKDAVLPLRTFIQETLRRSRTSYSTLQVALYYLIVIRPHLPTRGCDISQLNLEETQLVRAKQCGRRMFLAALILASKYLQDRNYSARAWSKISGLNTQEINVNEMAFLKAVDWKLHMSEGVFQKWTDLVLKYTSAPSSPGMDCPTITASPCWADEEGRKREWCDLILRLSPDLNEVDVPTLPARPLTAHIEFCAPPADEAVVRRTLQAPPPRHDTHTFRPALRRFDTNLTPAASSDVVFRSAAATPKPLSSMASVSRTATTSALAACIQEPRPAMRPSPFSAPACRRSSLGRCVVTVPPSPKAQEAAWTLNLLREAASPLSRKRSCPSIVAEVSLSSSGVTPKFRDLGRFGSPVVGGSPGERNKRVRCGWEMEGLEGMVGVAQGVR